jgi:hypothetical protein
MVHETDQLDGIVEINRHIVSGNLITLDGRSFTYPHGA